MQIRHCRPRKNPDSTHGSFPPIFALKNTGQKELDKETYRTCKKRRGEMLHKKRGRIQKKPSNFLFSQFESVQKRELFFLSQLSGILRVVAQHYPGELNGDRIQFGFFEFSLIRLVRTGNFGFNADFVFGVIWMVAACCTAAVRL